MTYPDAPVHICFRYESVQDQLLGDNFMAHAGDVRVIVFNDAGVWVAQCLEFDIGAQAADLDTLRARLDVVIGAELKESEERGGRPFEGIEPAPVRFQEMWDRRSRTFEATDHWSDEIAPSRVHLDVGLAA